MSEKTKKQTALTIRLTESAVFLRSGSRSRSRDSRPSLLRGLVVLDLPKPTRITSIELELIGKTSNSWPEGIGARRAEVTEEHEIHRASTLYFRAGRLETRRGSSLGPGAAYDYACDDDLEDQRTPLYDMPRDRSEDVRREPVHVPEVLGRGRPVRRLSVGNSFFHPVPVSHEEFPGTSTPPCSPTLVIDPTSPTSIEIPSPSPFDDFSPSLDFALRRNKRSPSAGFSLAGTMLHCGPPSRSLSPRPSFEGVQEDGSTPLTPRHTSRPPSGLSSRPASSTRPPSAGGGRRPSSGGYHNREGSRSRFSLSLVSNALLEAVRQKISTEDSEDHVNEDKTSRGRTKEKGKAIQSNDVSLTRSNERSTLSRLGDILKLDHDVAQVGDGWKEFKKGTYTYPISFEIPANAPPTLRCPYGAVSWRLRATVHRPGTFTTKLTASREVIVIAGPMEEDTEDNGNIVIERHWEQQLQYLISISGHSFFIGGTIPLTITWMPLSKVKIHRLSVQIEERIDYYTQMRRIARSDPLTSIELLSIKKGHGSTHPHVLPLESDDVDILQNSPLFALVTQEDDLSQMASSLMGPGPWTFHQELKLPASCSFMHFTNKNRRSNIVITHHLKCTMRVERSDDLHMDPKTGKRKLYDIVIQHPLNILSCRCSPEWSSLPRYSEALDDTATILPRCPCEERRAEEVRLRGRNSALERMASKLSSDSNASGAETSPPHPMPLSALRQDSLQYQNDQYERLISGQESEIGEVPPAYSANVTSRPQTQRLGFQRF